MRARSSIPVVTLAVLAGGGSFVAARAVVEGDGGTPAQAERRGGAERVSSLPSTVSLPLADAPTQVRAVAVRRPARAAGSGAAASSEASGSGSVDTAASQGTNGQTPSRTGATPAAPASRDSTGDGSGVTIIEDPG